MHWKQVEGRRVNTPATETWSRCAQIVKNQYLLHLTTRGQLRLNRNYLFNVSIIQTHPRSFESEDGRTSTPVKVDVEAFTRLESRIAANSVDKTSELFGLRGSTSRHSTSWMQKPFMLPVERHDLMRKCMDWISSKSKFKRGRLFFAVRW